MVYGVNRPLLAFLARVLYIYKLERINKALRARRLGLLIGGSV